MGLNTRSPKRTSPVTEPPRWLMPFISLFLTSKFARSATSARISVPFRTPCPPRPATTTLITAGGIFFFLLAFAGFGFVLFQLLGDQDARPAGDNHRELVPILAVV